ncbi:hypothetical protein [Sphingomonas sp. LH128]|uniref:hypothetical protein n=1 Tax=Sphingomonas sp. LH128 TaxID=473781 RepID=UPI00155E1663|nr:hypothetical protein [Sphingomonas sp. LH128]
MTTLADIVATLEPLANSKVAASLLPVIVSSLLASGVALVTYRFKSKESLSASITWQWQRYQDGSDQEEPFLVVQNRSNIPAYLVGCRLLRGNFFNRLRKKAPQWSPSICVRRRGTGLSLVSG